MFRYRGSSSVHDLLVDIPGTAIPGTPTDVYGLQILSETGQVWVQWTAPADNNSTITTYEVTHNRTGATPSSETVNTAGSPAPTSLNVTGLTTGSVYTFAVRAINAVGVGALSVASDEVSGWFCTCTLYMTKVSPPGSIT